MRNCAESYYDGSMKNTTITQAQTREGLRLILAVSETIREAGEIPSGHLYAMLLDRLTLNAYDAMIAILIRGKLVEQDRSHMLRWIGPEIGSAK